MLFKSVHIIPLILVFAFRFPLQATRFWHPATQMSRTSAEIYADTSDEIVSQNGICNYAPIAIHVILPALTGAASSIGSGIAATVGGMVGFYAIKS